MTYFMRTQLAGDGAAWGQLPAKPAQRTGNGTPGTMTLYPAAGDGPNDYVYIMAITPEMWGQMAEAIGMPELITVSNSTSNLQMPVVDEDLLSF